MTRTKSVERLSVHYERVVERVSDDEERDPTPSFPPMRVVNTDGETVEETVMPLPLVKCRALPQRTRRVG
jgi:hypothetical protein